MDEPVIAAPAEPRAWASSPLERHLERHVRMLLGLHRPAPIEVPRPPAELVRRLLRIEEREQRHRDRWGCFEFGMSESFRTGRLWSPDLDEWASARRRELAGRVALEPMWPAAHRFAICLTHDVDMMSRRMTPTQTVRALRAAVAPVPAGCDQARPMRALAPLRVIARAAGYGLSRVPATLDTIERSTGVQRELGVTGSYLFTVRASRPTPYDCVYDGDDRCTFRDRSTTVAAVVRTLVDEGFDVGLHGSFASAFDGRALSAERDHLSAIAGHAATSTRQHYLRFDVARTPRLQEQSGLRTDSTLGFNRNIGFRAGTSLPFHHFDLERQRELELLEIPLIVQESPLLAASALDLGPELARRIVAQMLDAVARVEGVATLLFHPHSLLDPTFMDLYRFSIEYGLERGAWVTSLAEIDGWWRRRERRVLNGDRT